MTLLTGITEDGLEVPVQVKPDGRLVAEGLQGPPGPAGPAGPQGPVGITEIPAGTAAAPGLPVVGDPDSGIYSPGPDQLGVATGGVERMRLAADGAVLVGSTVKVRPASRLEVIGNTLKTADTFGSLNIRRADAAPGPGQYIGSVSFGDAERHTAQVAGLALQGTPWSTTNKPTGLGFWVTPHDQASWNLALRISPDGVVGITATEVFPDNAAALAGGLTVGDVYRTAAGQLMIAF
jgi:hypothetical protein